MTKQRAAEIWAKLERFLIERCGLPDGHMLEVNRPYLIRWVGGRLKATELRNLPATGVENNRRATAGATRESKGTTPVTAVAAVGEVPTATVRLREHWTDSKHWDDTVVDAKLSAALDRACSRRTGYDGDDSVGY